MSQGLCGWRGAPCEPRQALDAAYPVVLHAQLLKRRARLEALDVADLVVGERGAPQVDQALQVLRRVPHAHATTAARG